MKLRELIANLDLSLELKHSSFEDIAGFLNPDYIEDGHDYRKWEKRVGCLYLKERICTDTMVGIAVHLLDKHPVLISVREGRGTSAMLQVIDPSLIEELRAFVKECDYVKPVDDLLLSADLDQEMGVGYTPEFSFDLKKNQRVYYQNRLVRIAQDPDRFDYMASKGVEIVVDNEIINVELDAITVPWQSQKETT